MLSLSLQGRLFFALILLFCSIQSANANEQTALVQLVEYVGADYVNAVSEGETVSAAEFAEMAEFSALLVEGVAGLPDANGKFSGTDNLTL